MLIIPIFNYFLFLIALYSIDFELFVELKKNNLKKYIY